MMRALASIIALALGATAAHGNVWEHALATDDRDAARETYESELRKGDEHALLANNRGIAIKEVKHHLGVAIASYEAAAAARPTAGEPYFRLGRLLYSFYFECQDAAQRFNWSPLCDPRQFSRARALEVIEAWDAFELRAPLDPRLSVGAFGETEILFRRAILHTKLGTTQNLAAAAREYEKILARQDSGSDAASEHIVGNLAETYMMLGRLEEAVEMYREALRGAADTSTWYGFAVALDRDERTQQALDVIRSLGRDQRDLFHTRVIKGDTFFVPEGEKYYYFALVDEALGLDEDAIGYWQKFIASGAHPRYQPRAKAHLDALLKKKRKSPLPIDPPWGRLLR
jgi:tetratricopeptide (TPR) repeat protein